MDLKIELRMSYGYSFTYRMKAIAESFIVNLNTKFLFDLLVSLALEHYLVSYKSEKRAVPSAFSSLLIHPFQEETAHTSNTYTKIISSHQTSVSST